MSNATFDPEQHTTPRRVVFFGDSRAAWWDVPVLPRLRCVAVGVPGGAAADLARRFRTMVQPLRPDTVVVQMGVNDLARLTAHAPDAPQRIAATVNDIRAVVRQARTLTERRKLKLSLRSAQLLHFLLLALSFQLSPAPLLHTNTEEGAE
jgi:hypothetical protein